jgi:hypothetical protein
VLIDESSPQQPTSGYGRDKVACEQTFLAAHGAIGLPPQSSDRARRMVPVAQ